MIINFSKNNIDKELIDDVKRAFDIAVKELNLPCNELEVNISCVSMWTIKKMNNKFRDVNKVTDILSFPFLLNPGETGMHLLGDKLTKENFPLDLNPETNHIVLGDLYICFHQMRKQARLYGTGIKREFTYLCVHGLLHLLGYDHMIDEDKKVMRETEEKIMKLLQNN